MVVSKPHPTSVDVRLWPGLAICTALQMVYVVDELPGVGDAFEALRRSLDPALADAILVSLLAHLPAALTSLALEAQVTDLEPNMFLDWVEGLDAQALAERARTVKEAKDADLQGRIRSPRSSGSEDPIDWVRKQASGEQLERAASLLDNDVDALKLVLTDALRPFWRDHLQALFAPRAAIMAQAVEELRSQQRVTDLPLMLERVLGRTLPHLSENLFGQERVLLVPFPFMGPYLLSAADKPQQIMILAFDAERALRMLSYAGEGIDISVLKALADETRLKILRFVGKGERFGGEIVTHLQISQPGVSRHLRLLTASGLLRVRQEGTTKYYSISDTRLDRVAKGIRALSEEPENANKDGAQ